MIEDNGCTCGCKELREQLEAERARNISDRQWGGMDERGAEG